MTNKRAAAASVPGSQLFLSEHLDLGKQPVITSYSIHYTKLYDTGLPAGDTVAIGALSPVILGLATGDAVIVGSAVTAGLTMGLTAAVGETGLIVPAGGILSLSYNFV